MSEFSGLVRWEKGQKAPESTLWKNAPKGSSSDCYLNNEIVSIERITFGMYSVGTNLHGSPEPIVFDSVGPVRGTTKTIGQHYPAKLNPSSSGMHSLRAKNRITTARLPSQHDTSLNGL